MARWVGVEVVCDSVSEVSNLSNPSGDDEEGKEGEEGGGRRKGDLAK